MFFDVYIRRLQWLLKNRDYSEVSKNFAEFFTTFLSTQKDGFQVKKIIVGVNYDEKTKEHKCVIEKFVK